MATISGAETRFVNSMHTENDTMDAPAQDSRTQLNDMAMPTTSEVESVVQNYMRAMSAVSKNLSCLFCKDSLGQSDPLHDLVDSAGRRLAQGTTPQGALVLENQVPILLLKVVSITMELINSQEEMEPLSLIVSNLFLHLLVGFCKALFPLKVLIDYPQYKALKHSHLLDLMYHLIILKNSPTRNPDKELDEARFI
ncbi:hypothetical protein PanWU01x14_121810 [Parasponia andersonii]|uniref:Uncharacterized protein n=1 Tax=Parasponia andersonii TaxID=3476 RepID=A0A2P5CUS0_PARAD|nr:hypothetical protein PanWU01x14_121810 [Parasponia andersonii]